MTKLPIRPLALSLLAAAIFLPATARAALEKVTLQHINLHPATAVEAQRTLRRIDEAALNVCGASGFSLAEVKSATRADACWQDAAGNAVRQSGNVLLAQAFARFPAASR